MPIKQKPKKKAANKKKVLIKNVSGKTNYADLAVTYKKDNKGSSFGWKMEGNTAKIRIIPFQHNDRTHCYAEKKRHWKLTPEVKVTRCDGWDDCPVCAVLKKVDKKHPLFKSRSQRKYSMLIVDRSDSEQRIKVYDAPVSVWKRVMAVVTDTEDFPNALSFDKGFDFKITRTGEGKDTEYSTNPVPKTSSVEPI